MSKIDGLLFAFILIEQDLRLRCAVGCNSQSRLAAGSRGIENQPKG